MEVKVNGVQVKSIEVKVSPIDTIVEVICNIVGCTNYKDSHNYQYMIKEDKLIELYNTSYHGSDTWEEKCIITMDKDKIELFEHLEKSLMILKRVRYNSISKKLRCGI